MKKKATVKKKPEPVVLNPSPSLPRDLVGTYQQRPKEGQVFVCARCLAKDDQLLRRYDQATEKNTDEFTPVIESDTWFEGEVCVGCHKQVFK